MGHVHLRVADVDETVGFYRDVLGFDLMAQLGAQAAFLSAGGYHHHLGGEHLGEPRRRPGAGRAARRCSTPRSCCRTTAARDAAAERVGGTRVADPSGNTLVLDVG